MNDTFGARDFGHPSRRPRGAYPAYVSTADALGGQKTRAYRGCGSGEMIGPGLAGRGLPAAGTDVPSPRAGSTGSS